MWVSGYWTNGKALPVCGALIFRWRLSIQSMVGPVAHEVGDLGEEGGEGFGVRGLDGGVLHGGAHEVEPAVALGEADGEGHVAHAQAGVAAFFDVGLGAAEAEDEEVGEAFFGAGPVVLRVEGADDFVLPDTLVKGGDEGTQGGLAKFGVKGGGGVAHEGIGEVSVRREARRLFALLSFFGNE